ncbi:NYN domain-containing protein [Patescibacteria group bacterium]|nr:NYN domain-containing protein [Patescibacteria group bacterium]
MVDSNSVTPMRVQIFIDGGNFHHLALKSLGIKAVEFDFDAFALFLADGRTVTEMGKRYYVGTVREKEGDERSKQVMARQTQLFNTLKKTAWQIKTSKLRERSERIFIDSRVDDFQTIKKKGVSEIVYKTFREKGIDVKIATDLVAGALDDKYDAAILVSSDTDLVPMVDWIRFRLNKKVEYIGFSIPDASGKGNDVKPTQALISRTDVQRVLVESDVRRFLLPSQPSILDATSL